MSDLEYILINNGCDRWCYINHDCDNCWYKKHVQYELDKLQSRYAIYQKPKSLRILCL